MSLDGAVPTESPVDKVVTFPKSSTVGRLAPATETAAGDFLSAWSVVGGGDDDIMTTQMVDYDNLARLMLTANTIEELT